MLGRFFQDLPFLFFEIGGLLSFARMPRPEGRDECRREPSGALAPILRSSTCYGGWKGGLKAMESFAILIQDAPRGSAGTLHFPIAFNIS